MWGPSPTHGHNTITGRHGVVRAAVAGDAGVRRRVRMGVGVGVVAHGRAGHARVAVAYRRAPPGFYFEAAAAAASAADGACPTPSTPATPTVGSGIRGVVMMDEGGQGGALGAADGVVPVDGCVKIVYKEAHRLLGRRATDAVHLWVRERPRGRGVNG